MIGGRCLGSLVLKQTWDKTGSGYCYENSQCILNPTQIDFSGGADNATDIEDPYINSVRCVEAGDFVGDHYCDEGEWITRTSMIAGQMINIAEGGGYDEYTLFCDKYESVLNYFDYTIGAGYAEDYYGYNPVVHFVLAFTSILSGESEILSLAFESSKAD